LLKIASKTNQNVAFPTDNGFNVSLGNVYADIGARDAEAMLVRAQLCAKIQTALDRRALNQRGAAKLIGIPQAKLSNMFGLTSRRTNATGSNMVTVTLLAG